MSIQANPYDAAYGYVDPSVGYNQQYAYPAAGGYDQNSGGYVNNRFYFNYISNNNS
jgi:hypothetical protein